MGQDFILRAIFNRAAFRLHPDRPIENRPKGEILPHIVKSYLSDKVIIGDEISTGRGLTMVLAMYGEKKCD